MNITKNKYMTKKKQPEPPIYIKHTKQRKIYIFGVGSNDWKINWDYSHKELNYHRPLTVD